MPVLPILPTHKYCSVNNLGFDPTTDPTFRPDLAGHRDALLLPIPEIVKQLGGLIGRKLTAYVGGVRNVRVVERWMNGRELYCDAEQRLRFAFQLIRMLAEREELTVIQSWPTGLNPELSDRVPLRLMRENDLETVAPGSWELCELSSLAVSWSLAIASSIASFVPRGRLRWVHAPAREAEPRHGLVSAELGAAEFQNFQSRLEGEGDLAGRATRWTHFPRRTFGRADQAQPQAARGQYRCNPCGKIRPLLRLIEDMEAAAVEDELEWTIRRSAGEEILGREAATQSATIQLRRGTFDRERRDIDAQDLEAPLRQPKSIRPCSRADLERPRRPNPARGDELNQQRLRLPRVPGKRSRSIALIPAPMRHHYECSARRSQPT